MQTGTAIFYIAEPITVLLETGIDPANIVKQAQAGMPSVIDENSQETYTAEVYYVDANGNKVVLRSGIVLSKTISPVNLRAEHHETSSHLILQPGETTSGDRAEGCKFFKLFLVVFPSSSARRSRLCCLPTLYIIRAVHPGQEFRATDIATSTDKAEASKPRGGDPRGLR